MRVFKKGKYYAADIWVAGKKTRYSTGLTDRRDAQKAADAEAKRLAEAADAASNFGTSLQLADVGARYMDEVGGNHSGADNTERLVNYVVNFLGPTKQFTDINHADALALRAWRKTHKVGKGKNAKAISAYTVNDTVEQLKKLYTYLKRRGVALPKEPVWADLWLKEPDEHIRELSAEESARLWAAMQKRPDYIPLIRFIQLSAKRKMNCVELRWSQVKGNVIEMTGKGGKAIKLRITPPIRAILEPLKGNHPDRVFTFVAERTIDKEMRHRKKDGILVVTRHNYVKGERYPVTKYGFRRVWDTIRAEAGLLGEFRFRIHDYRHDVATKTLRKTGNLKLVSKILDHASVTTTARYAHVNDDDIAAALAEFAADESADRSQAARDSIRAVTTVKTAPARKRK